MTNTVLWSYNNCDLKKEEENNGCIILIQTCLIYWSDGEITKFCQKIVRFKKCKKNENFWSFKLTYIEYVTNS